MDWYPGKLIESVVGKSRYQYPYERPAPAEGASKALEVIDFTIGLFFGALPSVRAALPRDVAERMAPLLDALDYHARMYREARDWEDKARHVVEFGYALSNLVKTLAALRG